MGASRHAGPAPPPCTPSTGSTTRAIRGRGGGSASQEAEGRALGLFRPGQSATVLNGVDVEAQDRALAGAPVRRDALGLAADALVVGCVARFDPVKNLAALVAALERLPARGGRRAR